MKLDKNQEWKKMENFFFISIYYFIAGQSTFRLAPRVNKQTASRTAA